MAKELRYLLIATIVVTILCGEVRVITGSDAKTEESNESKKEASSEKVSTRNDDVSGRAVVAKVVVGVEDGWKRDRVEEKQLLASAKLFEYDVLIQEDTSIPCAGNDEDTNPDDIIIFLPRAEGLITASVEELDKLIRDASADIVLPSGNVHALVGRSKSIASAAKAIGVTSLQSLAMQLRRSSKLRSQHRVIIDDEAKITYGFSDYSNMENDGLEVKHVDGRYKLQVSGGHTPCVLLANPDSEHGRALLLAVSDYVVGDLHPEDGCMSCRTAETKFTKNTSHPVMVAFFISKPQPFLEIAFSSLFNHGLQDDFTHFFIYNQVEKYEASIETFVDHLEKTNPFAEITNLRVSGTNLDMANVKNLAMKECLRLGCKWYVNIDSYTFLNPESIANLLSLGHPVIAPTIRIPEKMPAAFWRDIDSSILVPTYSWDHSKIVSNEKNKRGYWHSSCIRGFYAVRHDILEKLSEPYTHAKIPGNDASHDSDLAFCATLRREGIPMVATNTFPDSGIILNVTNYKMRMNSFKEYFSNPLMWTVAYYNNAIRALLAGNLSHVKRPCHEVYEIPVFNPLFGYDLVQLANKINGWSSGNKDDPRKVHGIEPVPTVDQFLSQIGVLDIFEDLNVEIFKPLQSLAYPANSPGHIAKHSLIARFKPDELPGLPQHHDSGILTMYLNLTPKDDYEGGEVEFTLQDCKVKAEAGNLLLFPSRLTHPKILRDVTKGVLHKVILFIDEFTMEKETEPLAHQH